MIRKLILLCAALTLAVPYVPAEAASKKRVHVSKKVVTSKSVAKKAKAGTRKKMRLARYSRGYQIQRASLERQALSSDYDGSGMLQLASAKALIVNQQTGETLYAKNTNFVSPIASVTKLMTAMVMLDAQLSLDEYLTISEEDVDVLKGTSSRLRVGSALTRRDLLQLALMASENRAAAALGRHYPGGVAAFVIAMNAKAVELGMTQSRFADPTGLSSDNVSTAEDLVKMVKAAYHYPEIRQATTTASYEVPVNGQYPVNFNNTNLLVRKGEWNIGLSKTGYISEAGRCLVMQAEIANQPMIIVLLDSNGKYTRIGDAQRVRKWIEHTHLGQFGTEQHQG